MSTPKSVHKYPRLDEVRRIDLPHHHRDDGDLVVLETGAQVPFVIERVFTIIAPLGAKRGNHAHRRCMQFLLCTCGAIDIHCDDGREHRIFTLDQGNQALLGASHDMEHSQLSQSGLGDHRSMRPPL